MARPVSARSLAVLWCLDAQIFSEAAIQALRDRRREEAIRAMQAALACSRLAAERIEGLDMNRPSPQRR